MATKIELNELSTDKYLESLSPKEYKAYLIAKDHLGSSFSLVKSVGYLSYKKKIIEKIENQLPPQNS